MTMLQLFVVDKWRCVVTI